MDIPQNRIIGALILLLGVSCLVVGIYSGQVNTIVEMLKKVFSPVLP